MLDGGEEGVEFGERGTLRCFQLFHCGDSAGEFSLRPAWPAACPEIDKGGRATVPGCRRTDGVAPPWHTATAPSLRFCSPISCSARPIRGSRSTGRAGSGRGPASLPHVARRRRHGLALRGGSDPTAGRRLLAEHSPRLRSRPASGRTPARRVPRSLGGASRDVAPLHAHGLHRALERARQGLGLSVPRRPLPPHRKGSYGPPTCDLDRSGDASARDAGKGLALESDGALRSATRRSE